MSATAAIHAGTDCECVYRLRHLLIVDHENAELTKLLALKFEPRPDEPRLGMTKLGVLRDEYSATVEGRPPRFVNKTLGPQANSEYFEWAARADTWAEAAMNCD